MPSYSLRPLGAEDQWFLWRMLYHAIFVPPGANAPPFEVVYSPALARYGEAWGRPDDLGFVAVDSQSQEAVGAAWLRVLTGEQRGYGFVDADTPELSIALLPDYRGQGIGTALLTALLDAADQRFSAVSLSVSHENPAQRLYARFSFTVVGDDGEALTMIRVRGQVRR